VSETYDPNEEALDQLYRLSVSQDELDEFDDQNELDEEGQRRAENEQEHPAPRPRRSETRSKTSSPATATGRSLDMGVAR
jgi:hypothetical protein